jgi:hypothetical protein
MTLTPAEARLVAQATGPALRAAREAQAEGGDPTEAFRTEMEDRLFGEAVFAGVAATWISDLALERAYAAKLGGAT